MSQFLLESYGLQAFDAASSAVDERLLLQVRELLAGLYPAGPFERRRDQRYPLPKLIELRPAAADGTPTGPAIVVSGKHISESGISFFHPQPLAERLVLASLENSAGRPTDFLVDLEWCRCTRLGWYESGGKFTKPAGS